MRWRRLTRPLTLIALLLLAGAVVNVAVAWGIAGWNRQWGWPPYSREELSRPPPWAQGVLGVQPAPATGSWQPQYRVWVMRGPLWRRAAGGDLIGTTFANEPWICRTQVGWPLPSLQSEVEAPESRMMILSFSDIGTGRDAFQPQLDLTQATRIVGIRAPAGLAGRYGFSITDGVIPIVPTLPGFLLNTLFYAAALGAILALPLSFFPIRRRLRARRGRCPKCGYDLAGLAGAETGGEGGEGGKGGACPECGAAAPARPGRAVR